VARSFLSLVLQNGKEYKTFKDVTASRFAVRPPDIPAVGNAAPAFNLRGAMTGESGGPKHVDALFAVQGKLSPLKDKRVSNS
jgi:hypothetical protein